MKYIDYAEFYITNVCNLACPGCNRFNNYKFKGFQRWEDYADVYSQWSKEFKFGHLAILGGEPLLNVDVMLWIKGLRQLWPKTFIKVVTNGFYLNHVQGLYELLQSNGLTQLWIGIHNKMHKPKIMDAIEKFLTPPLTYQFNRQNRYMQFMKIKDAYGVEVKVEHNWWFHQGAIQRTSTGKTLHNSDIEKAHEICHSKSCHHFMHGKLYKCGAVALFPEFDKQFNLELSPEDRTLINSYQPLSITDAEEVKYSFIQDLAKPLPQCKFCPEVYNGDQIFALEKKDIHA